MYQSDKFQTFVPFCGSVIRRYATARELPPHNVLDSRLYSGEIRLTVTAKTPIIVSDGAHYLEVLPNAPMRDGKPVETKFALFARDVQGRFHIPGSSLRGLIRQNMQILGLGIVRVGQEDEIAPKPVNGDRAPQNGLPKSYRIPEDRDFLDYPHSMMGFVGRKRNEPNGYGRTKRVQDCYRTRVSFGSLLAKGTPTELNGVLVELKAPDQGDEKFITRQPDGAFLLNGTRQYPLRPVSASQPYHSAQGIRPLPAGTSFTGSIRYRNLHEDELGLLLWCLRLEEGCRHTIGMAKSYGYGQIEISIDHLLEHDPAQLYGSLTAGAVPRGDTAQRVEELIAAYNRYAAAQPGVNAPGGKLRDMPHIQTFFRLKSQQSDLPDAVQTPAKPTKPAGPSQKELRKQAKKTGPQASAEQVSDWKAMLSGRFKNN